jgi:hypothetical protein
MLINPYKKCLEPFQGVSDLVHVGLARIPGMLPRWKYVTSVHDTHPLQPNPPPSMPGKRQVEIQASIEAASMWELLFSNKDGAAFPSK